jgi:hypothetical protein
MIDHHVGLDHIHPDPPVTDLSAAYAQQDGVHTVLWNRFIIDDQQVDITRFLLYGLDAHSVEFGCGSRGGTIRSHQRLGTQQSGQNDQFDTAVAHLQHARPGPRQGRHQQRSGCAATPEGSGAIIEDYRVVDIEDAGVHYPSVEPRKCPSTSV